MSSIIKGDGRTGTLTQSRWETIIYLTSRARRLQGKLVEAARRINAIGDLGAPKTQAFFDTARRMASRLEDQIDPESTLPVPRAR